MVKVVVLTDFHFSKTPNLAIPERKGEYADVLLLRAVHRLNRFIKPDLVFIGGDLIDQPKAADRIELLEELKKIVDLIKAPTIVISGNHDPEQEIFESIFGKTPDFVDINGVRFVPFLDPGQPGYNALRPDNELKRMRSLGEAFDGPLVSLQHVPLFPPAAGSCPYNYINADEIIEIMRQTNYVAALSGHYHHGFELLGYQGLNCLTVSALCEKPFSYGIFEINTRGEIGYRQENLSMPEELKLVDHHVHTRLAYCNENMSLSKSIALARMFGLGGIVVSEHSAHLYFNRKDYSKRLYYLEGLKSGRKIDRTEEYFELYSAEADGFCRLGMEIDYYLDGSKLADHDVLRKVSFCNGAVHTLKTMLEDRKMKDVEAEFMFLSEAIAASGVDALAHPFRIFRRRGLPLPRHLFLPLVKVLKRYGTAAEVNYHTNDPDPEFFLMCIENGVKLSFGSDSHNLYEVGELYPHLSFLKKIAPDLCLNDLLIS
jgi:histidinol phosphatase-like PHP family hydrolase/calcineurin-like phosphoesterase family protein